jgi:hypothetical protein
MSSFGEQVEDFDTYCARMDIFFMANSIKEDKKKKTFLTLLGPKHYSLLQNLVAPKTPIDCEYDFLIGNLKTHFKPKVVLVYERFKFYTRKQESGESIAQFVAGLKSAARTCNFGETLDDYLRDRFVVGLADATTQSTLLEEVDLKFARAVNVATAREAAAHDSRAMARATAVNVIKPPYKTSNFNNQKNNNVHNPQSVPHQPCSGCGRKHWKRDCPFKDKECFNCGVKGHIKPVCKNKSKQFKPRNSANFKSNYADNVYSMPTIVDRSDQYVVDTYDETVFLNTQIQPIKPLILAAKLSGETINMELDTGASRSLMSSADYYSLWPNVISRPKLHNSEARLRAYGGTQLEVLGEIEVEMHLKDYDCKLAKLVVIDGEGPCLLGRDLFALFKITSLPIHHSTTDSPNIVQQFRQLFSPGLGCYKDAEFSLSVDPSVPSKYCKSRPLPYAIRPKVDVELDRMQSENIIYPVAHSNWAAAIEPVLKSDGSIRICGDYKLTVNRALQLDTYPIPLLEDLFATLAGGKIFSKLDMSQAYAQLQLDEDSRVYTTINTHRGLFRYNRLAFGISAAPGIFQRAMEQLLRGMQGVLCYLDDILISGATESEHLDRLKTVLFILQSAGLRLRASKCSFGTRNVSYLGYHIDEHGIHPDLNKVKAIVDAPPPASVKQVQAFIGSLGFYRRFLPNLSTIQEPLNKLLRSDVPFKWTSEQDQAFAGAKELLVSSKALVHFDISIPLVVVADSSSYGLGAVLCHKIEGKERPICFASRTLTTAERKYAQVEKEALAMVFALKKFHAYLWGQHFTVITDHKPLLG